MTSTPYYKQRWPTHRTAVPWCRDLAVSESCVGRNPGRGKRGGIRVIYYAKTRDGIIWMLTIYAKNEEENIPAHVLRKIKEEIDG
jgi:mRNA-degrading endonuclease RelE of RelBE toxin-antitoxin system